MVEQQSRTHIFVGAQTAAEEMSMQSLFLFVLPSLMRRQSCIFWMVADHESKAVAI